jgi:hypothetical protein
MNIDEPGKCVQRPTESNRFLGFHSVPPPEGCLQPVPNTIATPCLSDNNLTEFPRLIPLPTRQVHEISPLSNLNSTCWFALSQQDPRN